MKPTLLILDDDPIITCVITLVANEIGFAARTTASVAKCLDALDEPDAQPPAAMIVDIFMPEGGAFDLLKDAETRDNWIIRMEHGQPLRFGPANADGVGSKAVIRLTNGSLEIADDVAVDDPRVVVHDAHNTDAAPKSA